jgi:hypothetical protein
MRSYVQTWANNVYEFLYGNVFILHMHGKHIDLFFYYI